MYIGKNSINGKQILIDRRKINSKEKEANAILYGMSGSGKSTIVKEEIKETLNLTQDEIFLFTNKDFLYEYDEFVAYNNFHLLPHDSLLDLSIRNSIYQNKIMDGFPIWVYIENGNALSKEQIGHIESMFAMSRGYHLKMTLIVAEYENWLDKMVYNTGCHIFKEMPLYELERFPSFYLLNEEKDYVINYNQSEKLVFSRKAIVKLMETEKENIITRTF